MTSKILNVENFNLLNDANAYNFLIVLLKSCNFNSSWIYYSLRANAKLSANCQFYSDQLSYF